LAEVKHALKMELEDMMSKRRDLPCRSDRSKSWIKVKKPATAAMLRIVDAAF
jgi:ATP-dependent DNA ligase